MSAISSGADVLHFETIDSTNEEAQRQIAAGTQGPLWIVAAEQTQGRGRGGRRWHSPKGNLYTSLLLRLGVSATIATQLAFVAALAAYDAAYRHLDPIHRDGLRLKWPNDLLLDGAKLAGVLIESAASRDSAGISVIVGIGINVNASPPGTGRAVASLDAAPDASLEVFRSLAAAFDNWLGRWEEGRGFPQLREAWLQRAFALNESISVNLNGSSIRGTFRGVDHSGALQLETAPGVVITVNAGDIYPDAHG